MKTRPQLLRRIALASKDATAFVMDKVIDFDDWLKDAIGRPWSLGTSLCFRFTAGEKGAVKFESKYSAKEEWVSVHESFFTGFFWAHFSYVGELPKTPPRYCTPRLLDTAPLRYRLLLANMLGQWWTSISTDLMRLRRSGGTSTSSTATVSGQKCARLSLL